MYANGEGVPEDDAEAVRWYRKAAEQGDAVAQVPCSVSCTPMANGVPEDDAEAVRWYRKAAEQGHADAQVHTLVSCTPMANACPRTMSRPRAGTLRPPNKDMPVRSTILVSCTPIGEGAPEDDIQAYAWISIAAAQGGENAKNAKEILTGEMTRAEIAEAQKLSRKYWEAFGPDRNTQ